MESTIGDLGMENTMLLSGGLNEQERKEWFCFSVGSTISYCNYLYDSKKTEIYCYRYPVSIR
jgi:hypothetical protein